MTSTKIKTNTRSKLKGKRLFKVKSHLPLLLMTIPGIILTFMFAYMPMYGMILAFKKVNLREGIFGSAWYGLKNFEFLFKSNDAFIMIRNTILYNLTFIVIGVVFGVALAIGLSILRNKMSSKIYQTVFIMPHFLSIIIVSYLVLAFLNMENGFLNKLLESTFGRQSINWYVEKKWWPLILIITYTWKSVGFGSIIYLASIAGIDPQLYEAASIDGANGWQMIRNITIPMLKTIICIQVILQVGTIFGGDFGLFYQVPMNSGALSDVTTTIPVYVYNNIASGEPRTLGLAAATSFMQSICGCALVIITNAVVTKIDNDSALF